MWLLPFFPSGLGDDGYDVRDHTAVDPSYGSMDDFRTFVREAHRRDIRVIVELVLNHTSDRHPWFRRARHAPPDSRERDFYVWSGDPTTFGDARVIFSDFETSNWRWDPVAGAHHWHRFYGHQPDLNYDNPLVRLEILRVVDFWLAEGVDGLRLDAVPYLFERHGTACESLPETHVFLRELRAHVESRFPGRMLLAEANQRPEDAAAYFGSGDEVHMAFHFPLMPRMFLAVATGDREPIVRALEHTPPIPQGCQWALFLRNHDELSLEMVTEDEREAMYRAYATDPRTRLNLGIRRRLAPLLGDRRDLIELMNSLLFSLAGTPVLYYGDEIGMEDDLRLPDRHGLRTPMLWTSRGSAGVEAQRADPGSLWRWTRRLIDIRRGIDAFSRGSLEVLETGTPHVLAFLREHEDERVVVAANLSGSRQPVELDLRPFSGAVPRPVLGDLRVPPVDGIPSRFELGPHGFAWLALEGTVMNALLPRREAVR